MKFYCQNHLQSLSLFRNDKKMNRLLTGVSDGCDNCLVPRQLWTDLDTVEEGFPKNRTFENILETWNSLEKDMYGEVVKRRGDYETRQGLCHPPVTLRETWSFTLTHKVYTSQIRELIDGVFNFQKYSVKL